MLPATWERLRARIGQTLDAFHAERPDLPGIGLEQLRKGEKPALPAPIFVAALRRLAEAGEIALDRTWVRRPGHEVKFSDEEERIWGLIRPRLAAEPYRPPRVRDIAKAMGIDEGFVRRLMRMAGRRGDVEEIAHDHFFLRSVVERMAQIAIDVAGRAPEGKFTAADFRDRLDNGRKVAIQILEFFDRHGFTMRRQDLRRINPARIEFFAPKAAQTVKRRSPAPGGATGLQIRVGPSDGLRWVRLPSSSATPSRGFPMTPAAMALVAEFESAAKSAQVAEAELRKTMTEQIARLERQRAFAFRRTRLDPHAGGQRRLAEPGEPEQVWAAQRQAVQRRAGLDRQERGLRRNPERDCSRSPRRSGNACARSKGRCRRRSRRSWRRSRPGSRARTASRSMRCSTSMFPRCPLSTSERTEFDEWLASMVRQHGEFTVLVVLDQDRRPQRRAAVLDLPARDRRRGRLGGDQDHVRGLGPELGRRRLLPDQGRQRRPDRQPDRAPAPRTSWKPRSPRIA